VPLPDRQERQHYRCSTGKSRNGSSNSATTTATERDTACHQWASTAERLPPNQRREGPAAQQPQQQPRQGATPPATSGQAPPSAYTSQSAS
jgi:hypothetical protein